MKPRFKKLAPAPDRRDALTPDNLRLIEAIARNGSFAAAARELGRVPSALTYSVRQLEDSLDALLFDRSSRQARLTAAGEELLTQAQRLLQELDTVANRVHRVATGWESRLTLAAEGLISRYALFEMMQAFYAACALARHAEGGAGGGTQLRLRTEVLAGTWEALVSGQADLAIGTGDLSEPPEGIQVETLGSVPLVFAVAPGHPLARQRGAIGDRELARHRAVAVADSARRSSTLTVNLLPGQDVLTVSNMPEKLQAQLAGLGCGYLPEPYARPYLAGGTLVACRLQRPERAARLGYAWRAASRAAPGGLALRWWLVQLRSAPVRAALLERHLPDGPAPRV
jgi:DNA-binding transcriptional LysR family regulator